MRTHVVRRTNTKDLQWCEENGRAIPKGDKPLWIIHAVAGWTPEFKLVRANSRREAAAAVGITL